jgi:hypothetical protein
MFHATGDPEWLYNIAGRPLFGWLGAAIFYLGIITRVAHLNQANARFVLLWLAAGIAPAFISYPASSLSHTILAMPAVYILMAMPMKAMARRWRWTTVPLVILTLVTVALRDIPDYFVRWPQAPMVRFLYRGDYRDLAQYLDAHPEIKDAAVSSFLFGPWDRLALETDMKREEVRLRWVNPERAIVIPKPPEGDNHDNVQSTIPFYFQEEQPPHPGLKPLLSSSPPLEAPEGLQAVALSYEQGLPYETLTPRSETVGELNGDPTPRSETVGELNGDLTLRSEIFDGRGESVDQAIFEAALQLHTITISGPDRQPGLTEAITVTTVWEVVGPLPLPPEKLIPNPPPPGVYNGPRLKVFVHLLTPDGSLLAGDDGLWVEPYTLKLGDYFVQWHHLNFTPNLTEALKFGEARSYHLALGLYDPLTGQRWSLKNGADRVIMVIQNIQN